MANQFSGAETPFEKWNSSVTYLNQLPASAIPEQMRQQLLTQVFDAAETHTFTAEQQLVFARRLQWYRDLKNALDTAREEGRQAGLAMARQARAQA